MSRSPRHSQASTPPPDPRPIGSWASWTLYAVEPVTAKRATAVCIYCGCAKEISIAGSIPSCGCIRRPPREVRTLKAPSLRASDALAAYARLKAARARARARRPR
jgi:hypothetical protein